jgi:hypothetical protein
MCRINVSKSQRKAKIHKIAFPTYGNSSHTYAKSSILTGVNLPHDFIISCTYSLLSITQISPDEQINSILVTLQSVFLVTDQHIIQMITCSIMSTMLMLHGIPHNPLRRNNLQVVLQSCFICYSSSQLHHNLPLHHLL